MDAFGVTPQKFATTVDQEPFGAGVTPSRVEKKFSSSSRAIRVGDPSTSE
jgi:hypothetical protein